MKQPIFRGTCTALVTPFSDHGIDFAALDRLLESQLVAGVEALVAAGTTGEAATLTHEELLANCEVYQEIAYSQLSEEELSR